MDRYRKIMSFPRWHFYILLACIGILIPLSAKAGPPYLSQLQQIKFESKRFKVGLLLQPGNKARVSISEIKKRSSQATGNFMGSVQYPNGIFRLGSVSNRKKEESAHGGVIHTVTRGNTFREFSHQTCMIIFKVGFFGQMVKKFASA